MQKVPIGQIKENPDNPRKIDSDKLNKLIKSVCDFPEMANVRPIVVNKDMMILGGNMRYLAMKRAGWSEIPVEVVDWSEEKQKEFIIKDNVSGGEWDWDLLREEWNVEELDDWGLDIPEIEMLEDKEAEEDNYEIPEEIKTDIVVGDVIEFQKSGKTLHRLMCGDATMVDHVEKLMDGQKADMVFTDPPYGVSYQSNIRVKSKKFDILKNDDVFTTEWIQLLPLFSEGFVFVWTSWKVLKQWIEFCAEIGELSNVVIWDKGGSGIGDLKKTFATDFEVCLVYNRGAEIKGKRIGSVWDIGKDNANKYLHPTQKPVGLAGLAIKNIILQNQIVLDLFLGSGSTMVACHQLDRRCYGMELDPKYCQVVIDRMQKLDNTLVVLRNGEKLDNKI